MKTEFKAKFIQHLSQKEREKGFTLIELLVVIIIIGILAAIALPSFLNQAAKARQSEAKNAVGAIMRAQQSYRLENAGFATDIDTLGVGLPDATDNYNYEITDGTGNTIIAATPNGTQSETLKAYGGYVQVDDEGQTAAGACQSKAPSGTAATAAVFSYNDTTRVVECSGDWETMK